MSNPILNIRLVDECEDTKNQSGTISTDSQPRRSESRTTQETVPPLNLDNKIHETKPIPFSESLVDEVPRFGTKEHPGTQCAQFGCSCLVGWSSSRGRFARLCNEHLSKHRVRCAQSARKKRAKYEEAKQKATLFDRQTISLAAAQEQIKELQDQLALCQREMREMMLDQNM